MRLSHGLLLGALLVSLIPLGANAQDAARTTPWMSVSFAGGQYAMGDVNDQIREIDEQTTSSLDQIENGLGYDIAVGFDVGDFFRLAMHYQRMMAESSITEGDATLDLRYPASALYVSFGAMQPAFERMSYGVEFALGLTLTSSEVEQSGTGLFDFKTDLGGTGPYASASAILDFRVARVITLGTAIGYRFARTNEMAADGVPLEDTEGGPFEADYSGFEAMAGLRFYFTAPE